MSLLSSRFEEGEDLVGKKDTSWVERHDCSSSSDFEGMFGGGSAPGFNRDKSRHVTLRELSRSAGAVCLGLNGNPRKGR